MKIEIPVQVERIIDGLEGAGFEAFAVGGCVRDALLGRIPQDWDITTSATPQEVKNIFRRTIDTGIQHGTVTVMMGKEGYEVTTYRVDGEYEDGRHPKSVEFTSSLIEDLKRRDFTINAMAYSHKTGIVDEFNGIGDLERKVIRCVGQAEDRFTEDALRMLRAVRFSAQLGFSIDEDTKRAIKTLAGNLRLISKERIQAELTKLLISDHPDYFRQVYETGISAVILPEFDRIMETPQNNAFHQMSAGEHTLAVMQAVMPDRVLRWSALFHDMGKADTLTIDEKGNTHFYGHAEKSRDIARRVIRELKFDNNLLDKVMLLVRYHDLPFDRSKKGIRRAVYQVGTEMFPSLLALCRADTMAKTDYAREKDIPFLDEIETYYREIVEAGECVSLKSLAIKGKDLIEAGMKPGKEIGEALQLCLEWVLEHPEDNEKENLMKKVFE